MRFVQPPHDAIPFGLRAMKMIATHDGPMSPASANVLAGAQQTILHSDVGLDGLAPVTPVELAAAFPEPALRQQLVQGMLMLSLADGPPSPGKIDLIDRFAAALGVEGPELRTLRLLADQHMLFFRLHFLRHSHLGRLALQTIEENGLLAPLKGFLSLRGLSEDPALAARYRALEKLPDDTLGAALLRYFASNGFTPPGEKGGFPELGIWHDVGHVLTGYGTDPRGELQMVGFQAGYMKHEPVYMLLFGALTFGAGVNVTPLPQPDTRGIFATKGLIESVFRAMDRGSSLTTDLSDHWDHWAWMDLPIDEVRAKLNVGPA
jgi:hypothetical protein